MLSQEENDLTTQVGPGTLMGNLMREYWVPALLSSELPHPDCDPVRVLLLGEQLIAFRDTSGAVGLIANLCPHRGASLFFGRNEDNGLRCVYHGWKFNVEGKCVDMPNEPAESNFKDRIKATAYPCSERGGLIWAYMGTRAVPPPLPGIEPNELPETETWAYAAQRECNWLQALEGDIDTVHGGFLHSGARRVEEEKEGTIGYYGRRDRAPKYVTLDTEYGAIYGAYRPAGPGELYWRVAQFLFPCWTQTPSGILGNKIHSKAWVPMDDGHTLLFVTATNGRPMDMNFPESAEEAGPRSVLPNTTDWLGRFRISQNDANDYMINRDHQRAMASYTGIPGGNLPQDQAVTESMGPTLDRTNEHLGTSDIMIIRVRMRLLEAARELAETGAPAPGVDTPEVFGVHAGTVVLPEDVDWIEGIKDLLPAHVDHPELDLSEDESRRARA